MAEKQEVHSHPGIRSRPVTEANAVAPTSIVIPAPVLAPIPTVVEKKAVVKSVAKTVDISSFVTCIIVNFKTYSLVQIALTTFREFYPNVKVILVDNGSHDKSTKYIERAHRLRNVSSVLHGENIGHGPAMHDAIMLCKTDYVFTLDSDCIVQHGGFLERMIEMLQSNDTYSVGWLRHVDPINGVSTVESGKSLRYIHPSAAVYDRKKYLVLPPFSHSGAPCTLNMFMARKAGYTVSDFPIRDYIEHLVAGTRRMYEGRWNPKTDDKPRPWEKDVHLPI